MNLWQTLEAVISSHTQTDFTLVNKTSVAGGDVNESYKLIGQDGGEYFVKINAAHLADMFAKEAQGLDVLIKPSVIEVPKAIAYGEAQQYSFLVMPYISMGRRGKVEDFANALAKLHMTTHAEFGFAHDNYIGKTPQKNTWSKDWGAFFAEQRIGFQLAILERQGVSNRLIKRGRTLIPKLADYLNQHNPKPALVHGDLWSGNYSFVENGKPVIYDPACYFGCHEVDLAMLELFGNPGAAFFSAYQDVYLIAEGYELRKQAYNLYHILNHANFFAGSYVDQSQWMIDELLDLI